MKLLSLSKWLPYISADILNKIPGVLAISVLVGCYGGYLYAIAAIENAPEWYYLARPPEEIENLLAAEFYTAYAETGEGKIYSCYYLSKYMRDCWIEVQEVPELFERQCLRDPGTAPQVKVIDASFGSIKESLTVEYCTSFAGRDDYSKFDYVLLGNGKMIQRRVDHFHFFSTIQIRIVEIGVDTFLGCFTGLTLSAISSGLVLRIMNNRAKKRSHLPPLSPDL